MSLQDVYRRFLADPKSASLAPDIALIYITTTTRFDTADAVISHLTQQQRIVKKKSEEILTAIEGPDSLVLDVETTLEFVSGGGAYLPSLDDNFLADRVATFPTLHIVRFNAQKQIQQVKLYWDQGSLLKHIDVIGARSRSWPIRDAIDQTRLIKSANLSTPADSAPAPAAPAPAPAPSAAAPSASAFKPTDENARPDTPIASKRHVKDPYAADSLVDLLSPGKDRTEAVRNPRAPAAGKPPPRDLSELFVGHDTTPEQSPSRKVIAPKVGAGQNFKPSRIFDNFDDTTEIPQHEKPVAPKIGAGKNYRTSRIFEAFEEAADVPESEKPIAPKIGAGKNYRESRIFDAFTETADIPDSEKPIAPKIGAGQNFKPSRIFGDDDENVTAEERKNVIAYRTNPNRFSHFEIGEGGGEHEFKGKARPKSQHMSQWDFEDFVTPERPARKLQGQEIRHFGWSDDEADSKETPPARPHVPQPRRDAETGFQITDEISTPRDSKFSHKGNAPSLSHNPLYREGDAIPQEEVESNKAPPLSVASNNPNRRKDFGSHWDITDAQPDEDRKADIENQKPQKPVPSDRLKAVQMMTPSWETYDESPQRPSRPVSQRVTRSATDRQWGFGDR